jgi:hypothetical protein
MKVKKTDRGFEVCTWMDQVGQPCELQQSSAIDGRLSGEDFSCAALRPGSSLIWLGRPGIGNRMHLSRSQVIDLMNRLDAWLTTGSFFFTNENTNEL